MNVESIWAAPNHELAGFVDHFHLQVVNTSRDFLYLKAGAVDHLWLHVEVGPNLVAGL